MTAAPAPLLDVAELRITATAGGRERTIVRGLHLEVGRGETVGIVGESGSGKTMTARAIVGLLPTGVEAVGRISFDGQDLTAGRSKALRAARGTRISMLLQDPFTILDPVLRVGAHLEEMLGDNNSQSVGAEVQRRLDEVGITDPGVARRYAFQLSGGMRQRVALAASLARDPELLIADEATTALDVTTQAQILTLLRSVQLGRDMGLILITHDLKVAFTVCDRIYVLYAGSLLEVAATHDLDREPLHPYSLGLLLSEMPADRRLATLTVIPGSVPRPDDVANICPFSPRCQWRTDRCTAAYPALLDVEANRRTRCIRVNEIRAELHRVRNAATEASTEETAMPTGRPLLAAVDVAKTFHVGRGQDVEALRGVTVDIYRGESVGLVGESGSGKTTLGRCLVGLETADQGTIHLGELDVSDFKALSATDLRRVRSTVQIVFQDPYSSLDPTQRVANALSEVLRHIGRGRQAARSEVSQLLEQVGLPAEYARRKPAALSGGERQRVAIARALAVHPQLLVCDEPVSSLDVSVQAQILSLLRHLQRELGLSLLFITHDLSVVRQLVDRVYVMYRGQIVESGPVHRVLDSPEHEYTQRLIASIPAARIHDPAEVAV